MRAKATKIADWLEKLGMSEYAGRKRDLRRTRSLAGNLDLAVCLAVRTLRK